MFRVIQRQIFPIFNALGPLLLIVALAHLIPIAIAWRDAEPTMTQFCWSAGACLISGLIFSFSTRRFRRELEPKDGFLLVTISWLSVALFGSIPLTLLLPEIPYYRLFFETVSCLTTTGATALTNLNDLPLSVNYWRCLLSWMGGMGIIVLAVAVLPLMGVGGSQLFKAENSNLFKDDKLTPRIADTAKALYSIYILMSAGCVLAYHWAGMSWDDAVMFSFTTMSLSGIAPYDQSIGFFNSEAIEMVSVGFMVFSGFNFSLHFTAWRQRSVWSYFTDVEARSWMTMLLFGYVVVFFSLSSQHYYADWQSTLRHTLFSVSSIFSTTGFTTQDYSVWPFSLGFFLLVCSLFASCSGSTGGGVKMIRMLVMLKQIVLTINKLLRPRDYLPLRIGDDVISEKIVTTVFAFLALHLMVMLTCSFIVTITGVPFLDAVSSIIACIANTGVGLGSVGPSGNYADCNPVHLWVGAFCMFVGRLELFTVFAIFTPAFWRN